MANHTPCAFEQRRQRLQAATAFLKRRSILVDPVDKAAAIRTYRVSGRRYAKLAEEVIEIAEALGLTFAVEASDG